MNATNAHQAEGCWGCGATKGWRIKSLPSVLHLEAAPNTLHYPRKWTRYIVNIRLNGVTCTVGRAVLQHRGGFSTDRPKHFQPTCIEITSWKVRAYGFIHERGLNCEQVRFMIRNNQWIKTVQSPFHGVFCLLYAYWDIYHSGSRSLWLDERFFHL